MTDFFSFLMLVGKKKISAPIRFLPTRGEFWSRFKDIDFLCNIIWPERFNKVRKSLGSDPVYSQGSHPDPVSHDPNSVKTTTRNRNERKSCKHVDICGFQPSSDCPIIYRKYVLKYRFAVNLSSTYLRYIFWHSVFSMNLRLLQLIWTICTSDVREAAKQVLPVVVWRLRGGGGKSRTTKEKELFLKL